jgi:lincosamide nucleotidyltransferase A/C/D/E
MGLDKRSPATTAVQTFLSELAKRKSTSPRGTLREMMTAADTLEILDSLDAAGIPAWLDGGWDVDALVGEQTRPHDDLDLVIALADANAAQAALAALGFVVSADERPTRFVTSDDRDRRVDFHTVVFDEEGGGTQHLRDGTAWRYPPDGFAGQGRIAARIVPCLTAEVQMLCHLGYEPDATDRHDMRLLADRLGLPLPTPYAR